MRDYRARVKDVPKGLLTMSEAASLVRHVLPVSRWTLASLFRDGTLPTPRYPLRQYLVTKKQAFLMVRVLRVKRRYAGRPRVVRERELKKSAAQARRQWEA